MYLQRTHENTSDKVFVDVCLSVHLSVINRESTEYINFVLFGKSWGRWGRRGWAFYRVSDIKHD